MRFSKYVIIICSIISFFSARAQQAPNVDSVNGSTFMVTMNVNGSGVLDSSWRYSLVDDPQFLLQGFNDSQWPKAFPSLSEAEMKRIGFKCMAIFRFHLKVNPDYARVIYVHQQGGASEIYINGVLYGSYGFVSCDPEKEKRESAPFRVITLPPKCNGEYVIAVRYSNTKSYRSYNSAGAIQAGFDMKLDKAENVNNEIVGELSEKAERGLGMFVFFATIAALHLLLFMFYTVRRSNLYFSLFCFVLSFYFLYYYLVKNVMTNVDTSDYMMFGVYLSTPIFFVSLQTVIYSFFYDRFPKLFYASLIISFVILVSFFFHLFIGLLLSVLFIAYTVVEMIRVLIVASMKRKRGALLITAGFGIFLLFFVGLLLTAVLTGSVDLGGDSLQDEILSVMLAFGITAMPLSMSIFLAWDFATTNKNLSKKLIEVEELSAKNIEQEKEKQKILSEQNEILEMQVEERTSEINEQKKVIEEKNKDITDSINYAQRIQRSILPTENEINDIFKDNFVLFKPRDIVSGDFYQFKKKDECKYAILADCTGHGVPGALMSMIGSNLLKQIIIERGVKKPNEILSALHNEIRSTLRQGTGVQSHDGMDATVVLHEGNKLYIASANRLVYTVNNGELTELKPDKRSIGGSSVGDDVTFNLIELEVKSGMMIYLFSDGYADQFGGEAGKKFKVKNLCQLLFSIHTKPLNTQKEVLNTTFDNWKKELEQVDDVSLIGIRF